MKDTGGDLTIKSGANSEGLAVSISDTGVGLPAEGVDLIFDPFHTTKPQGTGMGLTIAPLRLWNPTEGESRAHR